MLRAMKTPPLPWFRMHWRTVAYHTPDALNHQVGRLTSTLSFPLAFALKGSICIFFSMWYFSTLKCYFKMNLITSRNYEKKTSYPFAWRDFWNLWFSVVVYKTPLWAMKLLHPKNPVPRAIKPCPASTLSRRLGPETWVLYPTYSCCESIQVKKRLLPPAWGSLSEGLNSTSRHRPGDPSAGSRSTVTGLPPQFSSG